jgi:2-polyprenyl-3-methyl-5-hydroxy-6-metoxy-1,4-benzoquinol methylase
MDVKDHSVSKESFSIWECSNCTLRFTQDIPDEQSIGKYYKSDNYISHSNTSKGIVNRLYHMVRKITLRSKSKLIRNYTGLNKGELLDLGAGTGIFASFMQQEGWNVTGLEPDADTRKNAARFSSVPLHDTSVMFGWTEQRFDAITLWHVLEHVHDLHGYLHRIRMILKDSGKLFVAVPNYTSYDAQRYQSNWAAYDIPIHLYHFSPRSMETLMQKHGFRLRVIKPMWFDSFYVSMLSEKYASGGSGVFMGALTGAISNIRAFSDKKKCSSLIYILEKEGR